MDKSGEILVLTGPPGSGKTTTAKLLCDMAGSAKVHLHADDFWHFIKHGNIAPYLPEAHDQNSIVVDTLAKAAGGYAAGGYFVVVDGILGPWFLDPFKMLTNPVHYLVMRPPLDVAIRRCQARGGDTLTDPAVIADLYRQLFDLNVLEPHILPLGDIDQSDVLAKVVVAIEGGAFRLAPARHD